MTWSDPRTVEEFKKLKHKKALFYVYVCMYIYVRECLFHPSLQNINDDFPYLVQYCGTFNTLFSEQRKSYLEQNYRTDHIYHVLNDFVWSKTTRHVFGTYLLLYLFSLCLFEIYHLQCWQRRSIQVILQKGCHLSPSYVKIK